jgi:hypothetical protein
MYEVKQAAIARAIDILRGGPLTAAAFAVKMWPDRAQGRTPGQHSKMGHSFLRRIGELNYVSRIGDLWTVSVFDGRSAGIQAVHGESNGYPSAVGYPVPPPPNGYGTPNGYPTQHFAGPATGLQDRQATGQAERERLARLIGQATEPVPTVTHDAAFGDLAIRGVAVDAALGEACAIVVLSGLRKNVYPPCGAPMLVGLAPAEGARALYLRWVQSGSPPELPRPGAWVVIPDGVVATPGYWKPLGAPVGWVDPEDVRTRIGRQRAAAGLA